MTARVAFWAFYPLAALLAAVLWAVLVGSWNLEPAATILLSFPVGAILTIVGILLHDKAVSGV